MRLSLAVPCDGTGHPLVDGSTLRLLADGDGSSGLRGWRSGGRVQEEQRKTGGAPGGDGGSRRSWFPRGWSFRVGSFLEGPWRWGWSGASRV